MKYLLILLILCSCSANGKLRRAERLIKQAEASGLKWSVDTVYKEIPVYIDSVRVDSIFVAQVGDTVVIERERLRLRYVRLPGDSVYIEAESKADTVFQRVPVTVTKTIQAKSNWLVYLILGAVIGVCAIISFRRLTN